MKILSLCFLKFSEFILNNINIILNLFKLYYLKIQNMNILLKDKYIP